MSDLEKLHALERRIAALEEMFTHQARALDEVSDQLYRAEQARETLMSHQKALLERLRDAEDTNRGGPPLQEPKPPHY